MTGDRVASVQSVEVKHWSTIQQRLAILYPPKLFLPTAWS